MAVTYEPIATQTISGTTVVTFNSIPQTYTDLVLVAMTLSGSGGNSQLTVNNDSGANYSQTLIYGDGTSAVSSRYSASNFLYEVEANYSATAPAIGVMNFMNYSNTTTYKSIISQGGVANGRTNARVSLWRSTAAISRIDIVQNTANYTTGTTFTLYGIKAA